jgi:hypothetical protein
MESLPLGVVLERREVENRWIKHRWLPVAVLPGAPARDPRGDWRSLETGEGWERFHAGTLPLELFRKETEGYRVNLSQTPPRVFVALRSGEEADSDKEYLPFLVTVCPYQAQDYLDSGNDVEAVPMPPGLVAFVQDFVDRHHVDEPFYKRKRKPHVSEDETGKRGAGEGKSDREKRPPSLVAGKPAPKPRV